MRERIAQWLERGAFLVLLLVVAMRPLLPETYESFTGLFSGFSRAAEFTTPATTGGFDVAIWLAAVAATVAALLQRRPWRWTGIEPGVLLMAFAATISTFWAASNKRLAINASVDWLTAAALWMTLANLCRCRLRLALLLAAVAASGAASGARSVMQVTTEYRETRQEYERNKADMWARANVPLDDPRVELYERRLKANEANGFMSHSNVQGSLLLLCGFAAVAAGALCGRGQARWAAYAAGMVLWGLIPLTGSRGALAAVIAGLALLAGWRAAQRWLRGHWRGVLVTAWLGLSAAAMLVLVIGRARGGLPGSSLGFRWNYWDVTSRIIGENLWTGVGALNFDRAYLLHKPIQYPEEIKDPHNFLLSVMAQWGLPGLIGLVAAMIGGSVVAIRQWARPADGDQTNLPAGVSPSALYRWLMTAAAGFVLLRIWLMGSLMGTGAGTAFLIFDLGLYGLLWMAGFALLPIAIERAGAAVSGGNGPAGAGMRLVAICGLAAFLLHNCIDFSILVPGTLTVFAALGAIATAAGPGTRVAGARSEGRGEAVPGFRVQGSAGGDGPAPGDRGQKTRDPGHADKETRGQGAKGAPAHPMVSVGQILTAVFGLLCALVLVYLPVSRSAEYLARARLMSMPEAGNEYLKAAAVDPFDPAPLAEAADAFLHSPSPENIDLVIASVRDAISRDPEQISLYRYLAQLHELRYQVSGAESDLWAALGGARRAVEMYPQSPDEHLGLAHLLTRAARATGSSEWMEEARAEYAEALALDAARPGTDEVRKWSPRRRAEIEQARRESQLPATQTAPDSAPAGS